MRKFRAASLALLLIVAGIVLFSFDTMAVYAQEGDPPPADGGEGDGDGFLGFDRPLTMLFPINSMTAALKRAMEYIIEGAFRGLGDSPTGLGDLYGDMLLNVAFGEYAVGPSADVIRPFWSRVLTVATLLWPLTLVLNVFAVARGGVAASAVGYADLKETIIEWLMACITSAASLVIIGWAIGISNGVAVMLTPFHNIPEVCQAIGHALGDIGIVTVLMQYVPGGMIFLALFVLALTFAMMTSILFAFIARYVMLFALAAMAPLALTMGAVPATRWLSWMWTKGLVMVLLLRPINMLMVTLAFYASSNGVILVRLFVVAGILSLILALNYAVIRAVWSAIGEIAKKAKDTADSLYSTAIMAAGTAAIGVATGGLGLAAAGAGGAAIGAGGAAAGGAGGAGAATAAGGAATGAAGEAAAGGAAAAAGDAAGGGGSGGGSGGGLLGNLGDRARSALSDPGTKERLGRLMSNLGRTMQYTSDSRTGRALGGMLSAAGDDTAMSARQDGNERRQMEAGERQMRHPQTRALAAWGLNPNAPGADGIADAHQRLEAEYGPERVEEFAPTAARTMGAAVAAGANLDNLAQQAGYGDAGQWYGNQVEERIRGNYGMQGQGIYGQGQGLQTPNASAQGLTAFDLHQGQRVAETLGRTDHSSQIGAYAQMSMRLRQAGGIEASQSLVQTAQDVRSAYGGPNPQRGWGDFAAAANQLASQHNANFAGAPSDELNQIATWRASDDLRP